MTGSERPDLDWSAYHAPEWRLEFPPGATVLDVGCGAGRQLRELRDEGCQARGVERDPALVAACQAQGLTVALGSAEALPEPDGAVDGVVCKVVLPYTDEDRAVAEIGRVLRTGGTAYLVGHGAGYSLRYLVMGPSWKSRFYGARTLLNTWCWVVLGRRLPGFLGDTLYQSRRRLSGYYRRAGLEPVRHAPSPGFLGWPVFLHEVVRKERAPGVAPGSDRGLN